LIQVAIFRLGGKRHAGGGQKGSLHSPGDGIRRTEILGCKEWEIFAIWSMLFQSAPNKIAIQCQRIGDGLPLHGGEEMVKAICQPLHVETRQIC